MLLAHFKCHYQRLNVTKSATQKELNQSYRKLVKIPPRSSRPEPTGVRFVFSITRVLRNLSQILSDGVLMTKV